jgi:predicted lipoprotein
MIHKKTITKLSLLLLTLIVFLLGSCTVKKLSEVDKNRKSDEYSTWTKSGKAFDPVEYVDSIWEEKLIPAFEEKSSDLGELLEALEKDKEDAIEKFGLAQKSGDSVPSFKVKATAQVLEYDDSSRNGLLMLDLLPADGEVDVPLQIGPVIRKTAIRDSVSFISFTDVGNQLQFASLADELNARMKEEAVEPLDLENIEGKTISFYGAIKLEEGEGRADVVVTPVVIELLEDRG